MTQLVTPSTTTKYHIRHVVQDGEFCFCSQDVAKALQMSSIRINNPTEKRQCVFDGKEMIGLNEAGIRSIAKRHQSKDKDLFIYLEEKIAFLKQGEKRKRESDGEPGFPSKIQATMNSDNNNNQEASEVKPPSTRQYRSYVSETIADVRDVLAKIKQEFVSQGKEPEDPLMQLLETTVSQLKQDLCRKSVFFGDNGIGKSFIINLLLRLTTVAPTEYQSTSRKEEIKKWRRQNNVSLEAELDDSSPKNVIWNDSKEKNRTAPSLDNIKRYCMTGYRKDISNSSTFLLPSQNDGTITTPFVVRVKYGRILHLKVEFHSEEWAKQAAFVYPNALAQGMSHHDFCSQGSEVDVLRWQNITGKTGDTYEEGECLPKSSSEIQVDKELKPYLGKTQIYAGRGDNWELDRQWISLQLHNLMGIRTEPSNKRLRFIIKKVTLYVPSAIVEGGGELIDAPGANDKDPLSSKILSDILAEAHTLFVVLKDRHIGASGNIFDCIAGSSHEGLLGMNTFLDNMLRDPSMYHMIFLHNMEISSPPQLIELDEDLNRFLSLTETIKNKTRVDVENALTRFCLSNNHTSNVKAIVKNHISIEACCPLLFTSLLLNRDWAVSNVKNLEAIEAATAGWALLGQLEYVGHLTASNILHGFLQLIEKMTFVSQPIKMVEELSPSDKQQLRSLRGRSSIGRIFESEYSDLFRQALDSKQLFELFTPLFETTKSLKGLVKATIDTNHEQWKTLKKKLTKKTLHLGHLASTTCGQHRAFPLQQTLFGAGWAKQEQMFRKNISLLLDNSIRAVTDLIVETCGAVIREKFAPSTTIEETLSQLKSHMTALVMQRLSINLKMRHVDSYLEEILINARNVALSDLLEKVDQTDPKKAISDLESHFEYLSETIQNSFSYLLEVRIKELWEGFFEELLKSYHGRKAAICRSFCHSFAVMASSIAEGSTIKMELQLASDNTRLAGYYKELNGIAAHLESSCSSPSSVTKLGKELSEFIDKLALLESLRSDFPHNFSTRKSVPINCTLNNSLYKPQHPSPLTSKKANSEDDDLSSLAEVIKQYNLVIAPTVDDANSMFAALADQLFHLENATEEDKSEVARAIRYRVLDFVLRHYTSPTVREGFTALFGQSIKAYVERMMKETEPGDHLMLHYIAEMFRKYINVWFPNENAPTQVVPRQALEEGKASFGTVNIGCVRGKQDPQVFTHWVSLRHKDDLAPRESRQPDFLAQPAPKSVTSEYCLVPDTSVLIADLDCLSNLLNTLKGLKVGIAFAVLEELDKLKNPRDDRDYSRAQKARQAIRWINELDGKKAYFQLEEEDRAKREFYHPEADKRILAYACQAQKNHEVKLVTNDINMSNMANAFRVAWIKGESLHKFKGASTLSSFWKSLDNKK